MTTSPVMTNAMCRSECANRGFAFSGTQVGNYCFCGNEFGKSGLAACTSACAGNLHELCGGIWANSVSTTGVAPPPPPVPANGGRCIIDVTGQYGQIAQPGTPGSTYRHYEVQRWVISATPTQMGLQPSQLKTYGVQWSTSGYGERQESNGLGTSDVWKWGITGARVTSGPVAMSGEPALTTQKLPNGTWKVNMLATSFANGVPETQQHSVAGSPAYPPGHTNSAANAFGYPVFGTIVAMPIMDANGRLTINEHQTFPIDANQNLNRNSAHVLPTYPNMAGPRGTIDCQWSFHLDP
jgi:hypothetical protein